MKNAMASFISRLTLVLAFMVVGCGMFEEVAAPASGDLSAIQRPSSPNTFLAGPAGFTPAPDLPTRHYGMSADRLFATVQDVIVAQPRTTLLAVDPGRLRADYVVRSRVLRFPDIVLVQVLRTADGQSSLVLYSYSLRGRYDFGVNRGRVMALLAAFDAALVSPQ